MKSEFDPHAGAGSTQTAGIQFKHLLLPVDFSESNLAATQYALQIARWGNPNITLLHVRPRGGPDAADGNKKNISDRLRQLLGGLPVQELVVEGDPGDAISHHARQHDVDLIIMPTRGLGAVRRFLLGSITAKVLHDAACPVFTFVASGTVPVHPDPPQFRRIACAVSLGPDTLGVMRWAGGIAASCNASVTIIHATPQLEPVIGIVHDDEWCNHLAKVLRAEIDKLKSEAGIDAAVRLIGGEPARTVAEITSELGADLLVVGRPQPHGLVGRLRTHSYAIISQAPCPVFSV